MAWRPTHGRHLVDPGPPGLGSDRTRRRRQQRAAQLAWLREAAARPPAARAACAPATPEKLPPPPPGLVRGFLGLERGFLEAKREEERERKKRYVQSRDYTTLAGHGNVPDNSGNPYLCTAKDLDYSAKRDTWLDQNETEMLKQRDMVGSVFANCCDNCIEPHDNAAGGPVNAAQVEALGQEHFQDGLHEPKFHEEGTHKPMLAGGKVCKGVQTNEVMVYSKGAEHVEGRITDVVMDIFELESKDGAISYEDLLEATTGYLDRSLEECMEVGLLDTGDDGMLMSYL